MAYSDKLKSPKWQKKRLEILNRDNFTCQYCGDTETELHVHHKRYESGDPWDSNSDDLVTICKHCHFVAHKLIDDDWIIPSKQIIVKKVRGLDMGYGFDMYAFFVCQDNGYFFIQIKELPDGVIKMNSDLIGVSKRIMDIFFEQYKKINNHG